MLQYGYSPAGGGYYWGIASWLVSSGGYAFHSPLEVVNAGDKLWGGTWQTGASGSTLHWESKAYDYNTGANSWITAWTSGLHWTWAYEGVLEVYGANSCSQLPSSGYAYFFDNYIDRVAAQCVKALTPKWSTRLAGYDVFIWDQCYSMEQTLRID